MAQTIAGVLLLIIGVAVISSDATVPSETDVFKTLKSNLVHTQMTDEQQQKFTESISRKAGEYHTQVNKIATEYVSSNVSEQRIRKDAVPGQSTCTGCVGSGNFWNGIACVDTPNFVSAFFFFGCYWGNTNNFQKDCSKPCDISLTTDVKCDDDTCTPSSTGASMLELQTIAFHMPSTIGDDLGLTNKPLHFGIFYYYPDDVNLEQVLLTLSLSFQSFSFQQGAQSSGDDEPPAAYFTLGFLTTGKGGLRKLQNGGIVQFLQSIVMPEALYTYDSSVCATGITGSSGACTAVDKLTSGVTTVLDKDVFNPTIQDITIPPGLYTEKIVKFKFGGNVGMNTVSSMAYHISILNASVAGFSDYSSLLGIPAAGATYTCGTTSKFLGVFDIKIDVEITGMTLTGNQRIGMRLMTLSQTGSVAVPENEEEEFDDSTLVESGVLEMNFSKTYLFSGAGAATCGDTRSSALVTTSSAKLDLSGSTTTCGFSSWYSQSFKDELAAETPPITLIACVFINFNSGAAISNMLYDPDLSTNTTKAALVYEATYGGGSACHTGSVAGLVVGLVAVAHFVLMW